MSLQQEIESSFGDGPEHRPLEDRLVAGRSALRRRRLGTGAAALAMVAAIGTTYAVAAPGGNGASEGQVAGDPTATSTTPGTSTSPAPTVSSPPDPPQPSVSMPPGEPAVYGAGGQLRIADGVEVLERIDDPLGEGEDRGSDSVALDLTWQGVRTWVLLQTDLNGGSSVRDDAFATAESFTAWVEAQTTLMLSSELVRFDGQRLVSTRADVEIVEQRQVADLPYPGAEDADRSSAAVVLWRDERWFVMAWDDPTPNPATYLANGPDGGWEGLVTLDEFLAHAEVVYQ